MVHFIKLLRPFNLFIIALVMYTMRYIFSTFNSYLFNQLDSIIADFDFFLLVFSTVIIAGSGNIINDYFDIRIDRINKPEKVIVGKHIKRRIAMLAHFIMNGMAVLIGIYLTLKYHTILPLAMHIFTTTILWLYSVILKRKFLIGNVSIAFLSGMVPYLAGMMHVYVLKNYNVLYFDNESKQVYYLLIYIYVFFAFLTTLIREILKDLADMKGDAAIGCKTIPIVLGIDKTKKLCIYLLLGAFFAVMTILFVTKVKIMYQLFAVVTILLPFLISAIITHRASDRAHYLTAATVVKISMLGGIIFLILLHVA